MNETKENYEIWLDGFDRPTYPVLQQNIEADVAIIGGGITGILSAYLLAKAGKSVILLEKARLGEWATDCTTAFLTQSLDTSYRDLIFILGKEKTKEIAQSHAEAINLIEQIVLEEKMDCEFRRVSHKTIARTQTEARYLEREAEIMKSLGMSALYQKKNDLNFPVLGYLGLADQATYHPMKFLTLAASKACRYGARIFEQTVVTDAKKTKDGWEISALGKTIYAKDVIAATYEPFNQPMHLYFKKARYKSFVCEFAAPLGALPYGIYEDISHPYHYFRIDESGGNCRIIFGGEDHRSAIKVGAAKSYKALRKHAADIFEGVELVEKRHWQGPILESIDGLPYIGLDKRSGIYCAFGFSGSGLTYAAISAGMFADCISGHVGPMSAYKNAYEVNRFPNLRSMWVKGKDYTRILFGGAIKNFFGKP